MYLCVGWRINIFIIIVIITYRYSRRRNVRILYRAGDNTDFLYGREVYCEPFKEPNPNGQYSIFATANACVDKSRESPWRAIVCPVTHSLSIRIRVKIIPQRLSLRIVQSLQSLVRVERHFWRTQNAVDLQCQQVVWQKVRRGSCHFRIRVVTRVIEGFGYLPVLTRREVAVVVFVYQKLGQCHLELRSYGLGAPWIWWWVNLF